MLVFGEKTKSKIDYKEASGLIRQATELPNIRKRPVENVDIMDSLGYVLAEDITSDMNIPPLDCSAMDGYAVISSDITKASTENPVLLETLENIPAGNIGVCEVKSGQASRIMTGAPMPKGADSVVMVERTKNEGNKVYIYKPVSYGENVRKKAEDIVEGNIVLPKGTFIRPAEIGVFASVGRSSISVIRRPKISVLATGNELVKISKTPSDGKIRNSNSYTIGAMVKKYGGQFIDLGIGKDNIAILVESVQKGLESDIFISTGGISVGDYDFVEHVLEEVGVDLVFNSIKIKPGKPTTFGICKNCLVFALPGYPLSSFVSFELFVRPAILKLAGIDNTERPLIKAHIKHNFSKKTNRFQVIPAWTSYGKDGYEVEILGALGSGMVTAASRANSLIFCQPECSGYKAGDSVDIQLLQ